MYSYAEAMKWAGVSSVIVFTTLVTVICIKTAMLKKHEAESPAAAAAPAAAPAEVELSTAKESA